VAKRDPHDVLGVARGASPTAIKAAWRRLARQHHPDLTGDDPAASRVATRLMAEINDAYAALTRADARNGSGLAGRAPADVEFDGAPPRRGGPPRPKPTRPVTGRVDTSQTFRPRNTTTTSPPPLAGQPPPRSDRSRREPLRASHPTGPLERDRIRGFRPPPRPALEEAQAFVVPFGKFHGHRLDEIAAFEPSYIDWLARAVQRDPDLTMAARVMQDELDQRGIVRRTHPTSERPGRPVWRYDA
jgi:curved DNA-binding protein CbpA